MSNDRHSRPPRWAARSIIALLFLSAAGCTGSVVEPGGDNNSVVPPGESAIQFTGPWADAFRSMYENFDSEFGRAALADSVITDQEMLEGQRIVSACYESKGFTVERNKYGQAAVTPIRGDDDAIKAMGECEAADGGVQMLYYQIATNPDKRDDMTIRAECLVREGIVDASFTGKDLEELYNQGGPAVFPWDAANVEQKVEGCLNDPEGNLGG